jgi:acyl-CoA synthetase (NDP forming)
MTRLGSVTRIDSLFAPKHVAVIGASARRSDAGGNQAIRNLRGAGFPGTISVVNPAGGLIEGLSASTSIADLAGTSLDAALVALPGRAVVQALTELAAIGCSAAVVPSAGLSDEEARAIETFASQSSMLVHGPNCMGVINVTSGVPLWIDEGILMDLPAGDISLVTQSGSAAIFVARSTAPLGFSKIISTGNELGTTTADYVSWLAQDPDTAVIGLVVESIPDAEKFAQAIAAARAAGKTVVALKVGRTALGGLATTAHTGAVLSRDAAYSSLFEYLDVPLVADYDELASSLQCLSVLADRRVLGTRVGVVTISGGQAAITADLAEELGVDLPQFGDSTRHALQELLPDVQVNNPLDAGGSVIADEDAYDRSIMTLADDEDIDAILVVLDAQQTLSKTELEFEDDYVAAARAASEAHPRLPVVIASSSSVSIHERSLALAGPQLPIVRGIRNALVALRASAGNRSAIGHPHRPEGLPTAEQVADIRASLIVPGGTTADLREQVLTAYGVPVVAAATVADAHSAARWAEKHQYPLVLKIASPDIAHRSDVGGVVLDIRTEAELRRAADTILANVSLEVPEARVDGFEVQEQVGTSFEAFCGYVGDPRLGATIGLGMGGTLVELIADSAEALAPIDSDRAEQLLSQTRLSKLLDGYRNLAPRTPRDAFTDVVSRLSWLATDLGDIISEVDLNPVLIEHQTGRVVVVDSLFVVASPTP